MTRPLTAPGRLVAGRYRLQSQLGGGGMGTVWLARDELLGRQVAIKQVLSPPGANPREADQQRQRALREGRIAARLSHAHAISVYDVALEGEQPWLVMEYLPSRSLATVLSDDGVLRVDQVAQVGAQVADALAATHAAGIVHRDVKPANILIGEGGRVEGLVKITDFGISHASGDVTLTQTGQITGTPAFLAPEVAQGHEMTEASDVFSLGATLYTCLEGQPPFGMEENALAMLHRVAGGQILPPRRAGSLTGPLRKMLAADPDDRPTMTEVRDELAKLAAGRDGDTTTVLLARTDLRSGAPGRARTTAFPAGTGPDGTTSAPADGEAQPVTPIPANPPTPVPPRPTLTSPAPQEASAPAGPAPAGSSAAAPVVAAPVAPAPAEPDRTGDGPPRESGRRRGRALWLLAGLVAAVLAGLIVFWGVALNDDPSDSADSTAATTTSAAETSEATTPSPVDDAEPSSEPTETTTQPPAEPLTAQAISDFLVDYHRQVLSDPRAAYARTGPTLRGAISEDNYVAYWGQFSDVRISDIRATDGNNVATATMELVFQGGGSETDQHTFTFLVQDGQLVLDSDY